MRKKKNVFLNLGIIFSFFILLFPSYFLLSPSYWRAFLHNPQIYLLSFIFFLLPIPILLQNPKTNNPFFCLPFTCSFILASLSMTLNQFLINYLLFLGLIGTCFGLLRTKKPFILLEIQLYLTTFFIDFFEVKLFWRTVTIIVCYNFIPFTFLISLIFQGS